jgi:hypothetical protein
MAQYRGSHYRPRQFCVFPAERGTQKHRSLSPRENYTKRVTADCRPS